MLRPLALSERLNQMLVKSLQRALHHSDAVESILILSFIQRAADLRNDVIQTFQGNRNPFIDHPEWATAALFTSAKPASCQLN